MTNEREAPVDEVIAEFTKHLSVAEKHPDYGDHAQRIPIYHTILRALKEMQSRQGEAAAWQCLDLREEGAIWHDCTEEFHLSRVRRNDPNWTSRALYTHPPS